MIFIESDISAIVSGVITNNPLSDAYHVRLQAFVT